MRKSILTVAVLALAMAGVGCNQLKSRAQLNEGSKAFKNAQFPQAVEHFKQAVELQPDFTSARLYLAVAYMQQYIPNSESPDNVKNADEAEKQFNNVLKAEPDNKTAIQYMASLMLGEKKLDEAEKWNKRMLQVDPNSADAYYSLGFIAWSKWYPAYATAIHDLKLKLEDPGPIPTKDKKDKALKDDLKAKWQPVIDGGLADLDKCLQIDAYRDDAMAYENLLIREKAVLVDDRAEYDKQVAIANAWIDKALAAKKAVAEKKAAAAAKNGITTEEQK
jgi:tetratricopeptide (TPR) repeat protein